MLMKRLRTQITDKKLTMHSLRHRMKDKLRNTGCPEAISLAILGHSTLPTMARGMRWRSCGSTWKGYGRSDGGVGE